MFATSLALLASAYSGRDRGTALGLWGATTGAAVAVGPLVGGVLTEGDRLGGDLLRQRADRDRRRRAHARPRRGVQEPARRAASTVPGTVLFSGALFLLIFGLIRGNAEGWGSPPIVAALAGAAVLMVAFVSSSAARAHADARPRACSAWPPFVGASVAAFVLSASMFAMFLYLTLYIQNILGYSRSSPASASCR